VSAALFAVGLSAALAAVAFPLGASRLDKAAAVILAVISGGALALHAYVFQPRSLERVRRLVMLALLVAVSAAGAKLFLSIVFADQGRRYLPYLLPLAATPMLVATLLETGAGLAVAAVLPLMTVFVALSLPSGRAFLAQNPLDALQMAAVFLFGSLVGLFLVHRAERWSRFLIAGAGVAAVTLASLLAFWFLAGDRQVTDLAWIVVGSALSGLLSAVIAIGGPALLGPLFGIDTRMQLMALAQLNHPLLRKLQEEAPGTFHHSVIVGNLAERAADQIGADALLVRVGCYFHDIGKTLKPAYYIENQHRWSPTTSRAASSWPADTASPSACARSSPSTTAPAWSPTSTGRPPPPIPRPTPRPSATPAPSPRPARPPSSCSPTPSRPWSAPAATGRPSASRPWSAPWSRSASPRASSTSAR
jgi:putative nucleotidyltransferase with HDIG domain